jgi:hypothetical protein
VASYVALAIVGLPCFAQQVSGGWIDLLLTEFLTTGYLPQGDDGYWTTAGPVPGICRAV